MNTDIVDLFVQLALYSHSLLNQGASERAGAPVRPLAVVGIECRPFTFLVRMIAFPPCHVRRSEARGRPGSDEFETDATNQVQVDGSEQVGLNFCPTAECLGRRVQPESTLATFHNHF